MEYSQWSPVINLEENEEAGHIWYMLDILYNDAYNNTLKK